MVEAAAHALRAIWKVYMPHDVAGNFDLFLLSRSPINLGVNAPQSPRSNRALPKMEPE